MKTFTNMTLNFKCTTSGGRNIPACFSQPPPMNFGCARPPFPPIRGFGVNPQLAGPQRSSVPIRPPQMFGDNMGTMMLSNLAPMQPRLPFVMGAAPQNQPFCPPFNNFAETNRNQFCLPLPPLTRPLLNMNRTEGIDLVSTKADIDKQSDQAKDTSTRYFKAGC